MNNYEYDEVWDVPASVRRRAIIRIYGMALIVMGLIFAACGMQLAMVGTQAVVEVEGEAKAISISYVPTEAEEVKAEPVVPPEEYTATEETSKQEAVPEIVSVAPEPYLLYDVPLSDKLQKYMQDLCQSMGVHFPLMLAVIKVESEYNATAVSGTNNNGTTDWGLCQVNSANHRWLELELGITDWLDPYQNLLAGVYIMSQYTDFGDNYQKMAMYYNSGPNIGRANLAKGFYTKYSYNVMHELTRLEGQDENIRTEARVIK